MPSSSPTRNTIPDKYSIPLYLALVAAGLAGNYFNFPIFFNVDFIFGGIFAMLALQLFGLGRGILAAAIIAGMTYFIWNHPYAAILRIAEVAVVGWLMGRRKMGLIQADTLYWLIIGMPMAYIFYHVVMHLPAGNTYFVITKQAINCIANALAARLIFVGYALWSRSSLISYREIVFNLLAFFVLCPALIMLAVESRGDFNKTDLSIRTSLIRDSQLLNQHLKTWVENRKTTIINLAEMAASRSPQQMQSYLELAKRSDANFQRIGLLNREATTTAIFPLIDELGKNNIGTNFADRPFNQRLKQTLKPMLSEVVMGRQGIPKPQVLILAPVVVQGKYAGRVAGTLSLEQIREHLDKSTGHNPTLYTLVDKYGAVIMTNRTDQKVMSPFVRDKGALNRLDAGISQWVPLVPPNTPVMERWMKSYYVAETAVGNPAEWKLILEQPVAPFQKTLYHIYTGKLTRLFLILLVTLALADFLSRKIIGTLRQLRTLTHELPDRLATSDAEIKWPESGIKEANHLINNFRGMANTLSIQFIEIRRINESLEQRVQERTHQVEHFAITQRIILSTMPIGACFLKERKVQLGNPAFDKILGYEAGETLEMNTSGFYPGIDSFDRIGKEGYPVLAAGGIYTAELMMKKKDDSMIWCSIVGQAVNAANTEDGTIWMIQEITERKRVEKLEQFRSSILELLAGDEPLQSILETIVRGLEQVNPAMLCSILLLDHEGRHLIMGAAPNLPDFYNSAINGMQIGPGAGSCGTTAYTGQRVIVEDIATHPYWTLYKELAARAGLGSCWSEPILSSSGQILGTFAIYHHEACIPVESDILIIEQSARLASIAIEKRGAEEKLRDSEERFRSLLENIPSLAVQGYSHDGTVLFWNRASELLYGYSAEEAIDSKLLELIIPPDIREVVTEAIRQMNTSGEPVPASELLLMRKDGSRVPVLSSRALFRPIGRQAELFCLDIDLTERKQAEEELRQAKYAAEAANIAKSRFLATMSHEIRTPMNGVIGMIELLQHTKLTKTQNKYAERAKSSGVELVYLLNDILDLSKIEADKLELETSDFDLRQMVSDAINLLLLSAREKGVKLVFSIDTEVPAFLKGDAGRLRQILTNVIGNAIKFTSKGAVTLHIRKDIEDEHSVTLSFLVSDSGIGIAADKLEHIFDPFTQADSSTTRTYGGTGLGLAISKRLAELMGGSIGAESTEGQGSTFWFTVVMEKQFKTPSVDGRTQTTGLNGLGVGKVAINVDSSKSPPTLTHPFRPQGVRRGGGDSLHATTIRILLIEDDPHAQTIVPKLLKKYGYKVDVAGNGKDALRMLEKNEYALALMDCMMPEMNGYEATAVIRDPASAVRRHDIPIIALTGNAMKQDRESCIAAGMDDHLPKPFILPDLLATLEKWQKMQVHQTRIIGLDTNENPGR